MSLPTNERDIVLSVVMPAYNEERTVEVAVRRLREVPLKLEIIAVNDGSSDRTREILDGLASRLAEGGFASIAQASGCRAREIAHHGSAGT